MLWETSIPQELYNFIYLKYNYTILNQYEVTFQKFNKTVEKFIAETTDALKLYINTLKNILLYITMFMLLFFKNTNLKIINFMFIIRQFLVYIIKNELIPDKLLYLKKNKFQ